MKQDDSIVIGIPDQSHVVREGANEKIGIFVSICVNKAGQRGTETNQALFARTTNESIVFAIDCLGFSDVAICGT